VSDLLETGLFGVIQTGLSVANGLRQKEKFSAGCGLSWTNGIET